ncbi:hypothetical protein [Enterobacter ludwigii]|uniref:hypothetical protein n=1 Tax=Enterobacter ludwigii TaxID=299767 RepID=UPI001F372A21|nr:hypothetical protein [Enterobacter ludwigii]
MSTYTKEQLIARINQVTAINKYRISRDPDADGLAMDNELFTIALAALEAEPVAYSLIFRNMEGVLNDYVNANTTFSTIEKAQAYGRGGNYVEQNDGSLQWVSDPSLDPVVVPMYSAPPAPLSVPEPIKRNDADGWWMYKGRRVGGGCAEWYSRALDDCRAAMLQGAENAESRCTIQTAPLLDSLPKIAESRCSNHQVIPDCSCRTCRPVTFTDSRFVVCPECGNKRCLHANDHRNACTGSNEPGQEGSAYPAAPQQEV